ncbi:Sec-independent protein translocase protein TatB [Elongatibacter sediminis]|uniref:Sec-independent protein translocase protein TatB n=1 Tax=Elongatibacter sediminis TaxID=3119006 RepID=A0AAW9R8S3_9GAMM
MFDVGFAELVLLFIIGLLILGPERLPKVARTLGGLTRKARSSWLNLKRSIEAEMRAEELKQPFEQFSKDVRSTVSDVNEKVDSFKRDMNADITESGDAKDPKPPSGDDSR